MIKNKIFQIPIMYKIHLIRYCRLTPIWNNFVSFWHLYTPGSIQHTFNFDSIFCLNSVILQLKQKNRVDFWRDARWHTAVWEWGNAACVETRHLRSTLSNKTQQVCSQSDLYGISRVEADLHCKRTDKQPSLLALRL